MHATEHLFHFRGKPKGAIVPKITAGEIEDTVIFFRKYFRRLSVRNLSLCCPHCKEAATPSTFSTGRYRLADEELFCDRCGETSLVGYWRLEGVQLGQQSYAEPLTPARA